MPSLLLRGMLFVSSYFPLALISFFLLVAAHQPTWAAAVLLVGGVGLLLLLLYVYHIAPGLAPVEVRIVSYQKREDQVMAYIAGYLVPFTALSTVRWEQAVALLIFIALLGWVYVNSALLLINPMLSIMGFHLYDVCVEGSDSSLSLLARHRITRGESLRIITLGDGLVLEKRGGTR
jgi:hypothetical protein